MGPSRVDRIVVLSVCVLVGLWATVVTASAASANQGVDDSCSSTSSNPYFFPDGPALYWHEATYSGGPQGTGGVCTMYTSNTYLFINWTYNNLASWYLPLTPSGTYIGNFGAWAFLPSVGGLTLTQHAMYQYWPYGHQPPHNYAYLMCSANQAGTPNKYERMCGGTYGNTSQLYFCSDSGVGCGGFMRIIDATQEGNGTHQVAVDEFDYCYIQSAAACIPPMSNLSLDYSSFLIPDHLYANQSLSAGQVLTSANGAYILAMQGDGNLCLYSQTRVFWCSNTSNNPGVYALMQGDGNLVIYHQGGINPVWSSRTSGNPNADLVMQCDGNAVIYNTSTVALWSTGTSQGSCVFEGP